MPKVLLIGGMGRAGSTIMANVLDTHPEIRMPSEEGILNMMLWINNGISGGPDGRKNPWHNAAFELNCVKSDRKRYIELLRKRLIECWFEYSGDKYKYVGDKYPPFTPDNFETLNEWLNPIWILMKRNEADTKKSMRKSRWNTEMTDQEIDAVYKHRDDFIKSCEIDPRCLIVDYEQFCQDTPTVMKKIGVFLDIDPDLFDISNVNGVKVS